jgi:hypothetical protein
MIRKIFLLYAVLLATPAAAESVFGIKNPAGGEYVLYPKRPCLISIMSKRDRIGFNSIEFHGPTSNSVRGCYTLDRNAPVVKVLWENGDTAMFPLDSVYQKSK